MALPSSNNEVTSRKLGSAISALWTKIKSTFAPVSTTVTNVAYDSTNKKLTKTINGTTSDIVTASTLKTAMSLNNVTNDAQVKRSEMGTASGVATLDANGIINSSQLPSYVDDVLEYSSKSSFPATGETGKIYVDTSTNLTWRWSGTTYVEISPSLALGETDSTAYRGDRGKTAYDHSQTTHARADATKTEASTTNGNIKIDGTETTVYTHPTTTAVAAAAKKVGMDSTGHVVLGSALAASDVGLGNVDNKSEATIKSDFTGSVADDDTGFPTGNDVYEAIATNGKGIEIVTSSNTFAEVDAIYRAGKLPIYRFAIPNTAVYFYLPMTGHPYAGTGSYQFSGACAVDGKQLFYITLSSSGWGTLSQKTIVTENCFAYEHTNELNVRNVPSSGNKMNHWFNYRDGDTDAASPDNLLTDYYFGNRNNAIKDVVLHADGMIGRELSSGSTSSSSSINGNVAWCIKITRLSMSGRGFCSVRVYLDRTTDADDFGYVDIIVKFHQTDWHFVAYAFCRRTQAKQFGQCRYITANGGGNVVNGNIYIGINVSAYNSQVNPIITCKCLAGTAKVELGNFLSEIPSSATISTATTRFPIFANYNGSDMAAVGSSTRPVYVDANGNVNACTYAISTSTTGTDTNTIYLV